MDVQPGPKQQLLAKLQGRSTWREETKLFNKPRHLCSTAEHVEQAAFRDSLEQQERRAQLENAAVQSCREFVCLSDANPRSIKKRTTMRCNKKRPKHAALLQRMAALKKQNQC